MDYDVTSQNSGVLQGERNRVLRNTYALLSLSMVPTVIGALLGTMYGVAVIGAGSGMTGLLMFVVLMGLIFGIQATRNSGMGVVLLLAFTFIMGLTLGPLLQFALHGFTNGGVLIATAAGGTATIFFVMAGIATTTKRDLSGLGNFLFAGLIVMVVAGLANLFFHLPVLALALAAAGAFLFSAYILYDVNRIVRGGETNYITATLSIYLDVFNLFVDLLQLLLAISGQRR